MSAHKGSDRDQAKDTGMAAVLIFLIAYHFTHREWLVYAAGAALLLDMIWPMAYKWPAKAWFGLAEFLGAIMSRVLLSIVFFLVLTPVALLRKMIGGDSMQLRAWRAGSDSVFTKRDHAYVDKDLNHPY
jgi:hypothetical protein